MKIGLALADNRYVILDARQASALMDILNECRTVYSKVGDGAQAVFFTTIDRPNVFVVRDEQLMSMSEEQYEAQKTREE